MIQPLKNWLLLDIFLGGNRTGENEVEFQVTTEFDRDYWINSLRSLAEIKGFGFRQIGVAGSSASYALESFRIALLLALKRVPFFSLTQECMIYPFERCALERIRENEKMMGKKKISLLIYMRLIFVTCFVIKDLSQDPVPKFGGAN